MADHHHQKQQASSDDSDSDSSSSRRRLEGKVAMVTGGARGIGEAIARLFVAHGARVVIADVDASSLGPPELCSYERCDVSVEADVERAVRRAVARHGRLDVLCLCCNTNNAAAAGARGGSILSLDAAEFERVVRANALGPALGMKHAAAAMLLNKAAGEGGGGGGGSIVSVSVAGITKNAAVYTASKHALVGLTKNAACELARHGIRVNCISFSSDGAAAATGSSESEAAAAAAATDDDELVKLKPQGATLSASDIAEAALFLASDDSSYVSGHNLVVDGGAMNLIGL